MKLTKHDKRILKRTLVGIRDLARTSLPPESMNMTQSQWDAHRLARIASEAHWTLRAVWEEE